MLALISNIFGYLLNFLYELLNNNFGYAIILFSVLLRIILLPITIKQQKSMKKTNKIQGKIKALQVKYKNNPEMLNKETLELYKSEKILPFSGCLSAIVQIIIILSVFYMVSQPLTYMKKANDSHPELRDVVNEYKEVVKSENNNKTRYLEIATISRMKEAYVEINDKINSENVDEKNNIEQNNENVENNNEENNKQEKIEENTNTENNSENNETIEENNINKDELVRKKELLEKLNINMDFMGLDLSKVPSENKTDYKVYIIPVLYVISSFASIKLNATSQSKKNKKNDSKENKDQNEVDAAAQMNKSMLYIMPIMTVSIAFIAPLGLALYWFVSNALMIGEKFIIEKIMDNKEDEENA